MRARTPIQGLRQKLRTQLRSMGLEGKFSTDLVRVMGSDRLIVKHSDRQFDTSFLTIFNGYQVVYSIVK